MAHTTITLRVNTALSDENKNVAAEYFQEEFISFLKTAVGTFDEDVSVTVNVVKPKLLFKVESDPFAANPCEDHDLITFYNKSSFSAVGHKDAACPYLRDENDNLINNAYTPDIAVLLPVYGYAHGGLTIRTRPYSCAWDSGLLGAVYITYEALKHYGYDASELDTTLRVKLETVLREFVATYDMYLQGDVWRLTVTNEENEVIETYNELYGDTDANCALEKNGLFDMYPNDKDALYKAWTSRHS